MCNNQTSNKRKLLVLFLSQKKENEGDAKKLIEDLAGERTLKMGSKGKTNGAERKKAGSFLCISIFGETTETKT